MLYIDRKNLPPTFGEVKEEWRKEGHEAARKQVALELLKDGMPVEQVAKYVRLSKQVLEELKRQIDRKSK